MNTTNYTQVFFVFVVDFGIIAMRRNARDCASREDGEERQPLQVGVDAVTQVVRDPLTDADRVIGVEICAGCLQQRNPSPIAVSRSIAATTIESHFQ